MGHIHAAAMAEYAKDALETDMPWERWEVSMFESGEEYRNLLGHPDWAVNRKYRRAPVVQVPQDIEQMAVNRYKVVPSHNSMFYPCAVVAGDGQQQLYIGREVDCQNMARKFTGAFLDGAFVALAAAPQPPEADHSEQVLEMVAAPVQLPEPDFLQRHEDVCGDEVGPPTAFYTAATVRALLAEVITKAVPLYTVQVKPES